MNSYLQTIDTKLLDFAQSGRPADVTTAMDCLDKIQDTAPTGKIDIKVRREKAETAFRILRAVQKAEDPQFNPKDMPALNIAPPPEAGMLPSGIAPEDIKDLRAKKQYEAAIAANRVKITYFNRQTELRHLEHAVRERILGYLLAAYPRTSGSRAELSLLAADAGIREDFQEKIQCVLK